MHDHMCQLLATYAVLLAHKHQDTMEVVQGTKAVEVAEDYHNTKKGLLENGNLNRPEHFWALLVVFEKKSHCIQKKWAAKIKAAKSKGLLSKGTGS